MGSFIINGVAHAAGPCSSTNLPRIISEIGKIHVFAIVPEPSAFAIIAFGALLVVALQRRKRL